MKEGVAAAAAAAGPPWPPHQPYFSFGVVSDIQYADRPEALSSWGTMRYYRQSLLHLRRAIEEWNQEVPQPRFVLQLGDIIDSQNKRLGVSGQALETVLGTIEKANMPFHHVWGNHELYNFQRDVLTKSKLNSAWMRDKEQDHHEEKGEERGDYHVYHFSPHSKFHFILLDTYDYSFFGRRPDSRGYLDSMNFLDSRNVEEHMAIFNGGMSEKQLSWLDDILEYCDRHQERAILAGHCPIHPASQATCCLAWNYQDILRVVQAHPSVACYFAGHEHSGGYYQDSCGIHHITMEGLIESPPENNAFATVEVYQDGLVLRGRGRVKSRRLPFRKWTADHTGECQTVATPLQDIHTNQM